MVGIKIESCNFFYRDNNENVEWKKLSRSIKDSIMNYVVHLDNVIKSSETFDEQIDENKQNEEKNEKIIEDLHIKVDCRAQV